MAEPLGHNKEIRISKEFQAKDIDEQFPKMDKSGRARIEPVIEPAAELIECTASGDMWPGEPRLAQTDWRYRYASFASPKNSARTLVSLTPEEITTLCGLIAIRYMGAIFSPAFCKSDGQSLARELIVRLDQELWRKRTIASVLDQCDRFLKHSQETDGCFLRSLDDLIPFDDLVPS
ncbi:MAG TPA: hypothetical protein VFE16_05495 [Candidatus Cybelea sp.]|nr:hypothetical protein [Candidatus Cybelea sp.]